MKNEVTPAKYSVRISYIIFHFLCLSLIVAASNTMAQTSAAKPKVAPTEADSSEVKNAYVFAGIGAFIPTGQSYMQNYSTKLAGLPLELSGGILFPITNNLLVPLTVRYVRRVANFVNDGSIEVFSIEPGVRYFLERQRGRDLRLFGGASLILTKATVSGDYDVSSNGAVTGTALAETPYLDAGVGLDLGFSYPLKDNTALDAVIHIAFYLASPVSGGGLGNIGGVSLCAAYRFGF